MIPCRLYFPYCGCVLLPLLAGCFKDVPKPSASAGPTTPTIAAAAPAPRADFFAHSLLPDAAEAQRQQTLLRAAGALFRKLYEPALQALHEAQTGGDAPWLRAEIDRARDALHQRQALDALALDLEALLVHGDGPAAARLAGLALAQFGDTDYAGRLVILKLQADALARTQTQPAASAAELAGACLADAERARKANSLRSAMIGYEQALALLDDDAAKAAYEQLRAALLRYDEARALAAALREQPATWDDALAALRDAAAAWNTPTVQREIGDLQLALRFCPARIAVADLEVAGDLGLPDLGRTGAEAVRSALPGHFEALPRGALAAVLDELKRRPADLLNSAALRAAVKRQSGARCVLIGRVTPTAGLTLQAELLDLSSGLIVQTARIVADSPQELQRRAPDLVAQLLESDQRRLSRLGERKPAGSAAPPSPSDFDPETPGPTVPPLNTFAQESAPLGPLGPKDFERLPPPVALGQAAADAALPEAKVLQRIAAVLLEVGDNAFRRGRFAQADGAYARALSLAPADPALEARRIACLPHLPADDSAGGAGSRIAALPFLVVNPGPDLPAALSLWLPQQLAAYFQAADAALDVDEVCWWLQRLDATVHDVVTRPPLRRALARALGARYFLFGQVSGNGGIQVNLELVDAELNRRAGAGVLNARDGLALKLRLPELARQALLPPEQQLQLRHEGALAELDVFEARQLWEAGKLAEAAERFGTLKDRFPGRADLAWFAQAAEDDAARAKLAADQRELVGQAEKAADDRSERLAKLLLDADAALRRVSRAGATADAALAPQREAAARLLEKDAQAAQAQGDGLRAARFLECAAALHPLPERFAALADLRLSLHEESRRRAAQRRGARDEQRARQRGLDLADAAGQLADEAARAESAAAGFRPPAADDEATAARLLKEAQALAALDRHGEALQVLLQAIQLKSSPQALELRAQMLLRQAQADAPDAERRAALRRETALRGIRRAAAEALARQQRERYAAALQAASAARAQKQFDEALAQYRQAGALFPTDAVALGIDQTQQEQREAQRAAHAAKRRQAEEGDRRAALAGLTSAAADAERAGNLNAALANLRQALSLEPTDPALLAGAIRVDLARVQALAAARLQAARTAPRDRHKQLLELGGLALIARQFAAADAYLAGLKAQSADPAMLTKLQDDIDFARAAAAKAQADWAAKAESAAKAIAQQQAARQRELDKLLTGKQQRLLQIRLQHAEAALKARQFAVAQEALREAARLAPTDPAVARVQRQLGAASRGTDAADVQARAAAKAKADAEEKEKADRFIEHMRLGRDALKDEDYQGAAGHLRAALRLYPGDSDAILLMGIVEKKLEGEGGDEDAKRKAEEDAKAQAALETKIKEEEAARLVKVGDKAINEKRYVDAAIAFRKALILKPDDERASKGLEAAEKGKTGAAR